MQYYVTWHRVANSLYIGKNKCETNKCEEACWESNVMNKNYELSPTASSSTCPEKEMHCTMNAPKGFFENCIWCSITIIFTYTISQLRQLTAGVSLLSSVSSSRSEEHTSELQSRPHISYAVFCLKKKKKTQVFLLVLKPQQLYAERTTDTIQSLHHSHSFLI